MRLVEDSLAEELLAGRLQDGDTALIDVDDNNGVKVLVEQPKRCSRLLACYKFNWLYARS